MADVDAREPWWFIRAQAQADALGIHVVSGTVEVPNTHHAGRGFVEGNPAIVEIREHATATPKAIAAAVAVAEALTANFGPAPLRLPIQNITYIARVPA